MKSISILVVGAIIVSGLTACEKEPAKAVGGAEQTASINVEQVLVPAGDFIRGSNREDDLPMRQQYGFPAPLFLDEQPEFRSMGKGVTPEYSLAGALAEGAEWLTTREVNQLPGYVAAHQRDVENALPIEDLLPHPSHH